MYDTSAFAGGKDFPTVQKKFVQTLAPVIANICGKRLSKAEMQQCLTEAAKSSGWGRFVLANNYWMLPGRGDAGAFLLVRIKPDTSQVSSIRPVVETYAKFSSLPAAVDAWCKQRGK